jgi:hypothetical protein
MKFLIYLFSLQMISLILATRVVPISITYEIAGSKNPTRETISGNIKLANYLNSVSLGNKFTFALNNNQDTKELEKLGIVKNGIFTLKGKRMSHTPELNNSSVTLKYKVGNKNIIFNFISDNDSNKLLYDRLTVISQAGKSCNKAIGPGVEKKKLKLGKVESVKSALHGLISPRNQPTTNASEQIQLSEQSELGDDDWIPDHAGTDDEAVSRLSVEQLIDIYHLQKHNRQTFLEKKQRENAKKGNKG